MKIQDHIIATIMKKSVFQSELSHKGQKVRVVKLIVQTDHSLN